MIAELHGCDCERRQPFLGDDVPVIDPTSFDLSSIDFGASQPTPILAPTSFPSLDTSTILDTGEPTPGPIDTSLPTDTYSAFGVLPTYLPPSDLAAAGISLMPAPTPTVISRGGSTAADIAAAASGAGGILSALRTGSPNPGASYTGGGAAAVPAGYTRNAQGQLVPISSVSPLAWLTENSLLKSVPNWAVLSGGVLGVVIVGSAFSGSGRRRRR